MLAADVAKGEARPRLLERRGWPSDPAERAAMFIYDELTDEELEQLADELLNPAAELSQTQ